MIAPFTAAVLILLPLREASQQTDFMLLTSLVFGEACLCLKSTAGLENSAEETSARNKPLSRHQNQTWCSRAGHWSTQQQVGMCVTV